MAEPTQTAPAVDPPLSTARQWLAEIQSAETYLKDWLDRSKRIAAIYAEQRRDAETAIETRFAILWANMEVLKPAIYAKTPSPVVRRRFADRDPTARAVAELMERSITSVFDTADVDDPIRSVRDDFLLVGRGTAWVRYVPTIEAKPTAPAADEAVADEIAPSLGAGEGGQPPAEPDEQLVDETLAFDFVHWRDLIHPRARRWKDLPWLAREVWMDDAAIADRFGPETALKLKALSGVYVQPPVGQATAGVDQDGKPKDKCCIYEIWWKNGNKVLWVAKGYQDAILDEKPPLYQLRGFFPCPRPAYATLATDSLIPVADYIYYQDQAQEVNRLTKRIDALTDSLKLVGFYPGGLEGETSSALETAFSPNTDNTMVPVPSWQAFTSGGGAGQLIQWWPVEKVAQVLRECIALRKQLIDDIYQITGISDILRGQGQASETATAQSIKAQWGGIRIRDRQQELARFARDLARIAGEIMAEQFQPETLLRMSGLSFPTEADVQAQVVQLGVQAQTQAAQTGQPVDPAMVQAAQKQASEVVTVEKVVDLLHSDRLRSYRIDIETDSMIEADEIAEKENRNEFLGAVGGFMQSALPVAREAPELIPALGEMMMFNVRGYRAGRQVEDVIEQSMTDLATAAKAKQQEAQQQPNPQQMVEAMGQQLMAGMQQIVQQQSEMFGQALQQMEQSRQADAQVMMQGLQQISAGIAAVLNRLPPPMPPPLAANGMPPGPVPMAPPPGVMPAA